MTTDNQAGIGRGMMRYARGVRKEFKRAQGARAKFAVGASGIAGSPMALLQESAKDLLKPKGTFWSAFTKNKSILGINLGIGSLLKQSQVFTGSVSSILQIIGALVDVFIAPFLMPLIIPAIKKLASFIDPVRKYSEQLAEKWVPKISKFFGDIWSGDGSWWSKIGDTITGLISGAFKATGLYDWYMEKDVTTVIGAFRESVELVVDLLRASGILAAPIDPGDPTGLTGAIQDSFGVKDETLSDMQKSITGFTDLGGVRNQYNDYASFNGGMDYGSSQVQPGMSRIQTRNEAGGGGYITGGGFVNPMDIAIYNSQNDGGAQMNTDKRDDTPSPGASVFISY